MATSTKSSSSTSKPSSSSSTKSSSSSTKTSSSSTTKKTASSPISSSTKTSTTPSKPTGTGVTDKATIVSSSSPSKVGTSSVTRTLNSASVTSTPKPTTPVQAYNDAKAKGGDEATAKAAYDNAMGTYNAWQKTQALVGPSTGTGVTSSTAYKTAQENLLNQGYTRDDYGNYVSKTGQTVTTAQLREGAEAQIAKEGYQSTLQNKQEAAAQKMHASGITQAEWDKKNAPKYMVSTPGVLDQQYSVTRTGAILDEKGHVVSDVDRDRIGRTAGVVEYNILDNDGNVTGSFLAPDVGNISGSGVVKNSTHEAATVSKDPNQVLGHLEFQNEQAYKDYKAAQAVPEARAAVNQTNSAFEGAQPKEYSTDLQTGFVPESIEDPKERYIQALKNTNQGGFSNLMQQMASMDWENMSASDALKANLLMTLQASEIEDATMDEYLNNSAYNANKSYKDTLESIELSREEIGKAVTGEKFIPQTYEGLQAQIMKGNEDLQIESIEEQKKYQQEQMALWQKDTTAKRSKLEGYLKAQLYAMGAQDSTAGLSVMAMQVNQADLQIQMQQNEYNHGLAQLDIEARGIMTNFTNSVLELNMQTKASEAEAQNTLSTKLEEIEKETILNDKEKNKVQMQAFSDFNTKLQTLKKEQKDEEWRLMEFNYKKITDAKDEAYKLSGLSGTVFVTDENGNIMDTGIDTFDNKKWKDSKLMEQMKFAWDQQKGSYDLAIDLVDSGVATPSIEQMLGFEAGSLSGLRNKEEIKAEIQERQETNAFAALLGTAGYTSDAIGGSLGYGNNGGVIADAFDDGTVGGQCGWFARTNFTTLGPIGDLLTDKIKRADNTLNGFNLASIPSEIVKQLSKLPGVGGVVGAIADPIVKQYEKMLPQVGDMLLMDVGTQYGHVAMVNSVNPDGTITLTESNWHGDEKVDNTRTIKRNDGKIVGINRGNLKPEIKEVLQRSAQAAEASLYAPEPEEVIMNNGFLAGVASGATKLTFNEELKIAQAAPQMMEYYNYAKMMGTQKTESTASQKPFTMDQTNSVDYASRLKDSGAIITELTNATMAGGTVNAMWQSNIPGWLKTDEWRQIDQAKRNFITAKLRKESGAAISTEEFVTADLQYFPQPGDDAQTIENKRRLRDMVTKNMIFAAGPAWASYQEYMALPENTYISETSAMPTTMDEDFYSLYQ